MSATVRAHEVLPWQTWEVTFEEVYTRFRAPVWRLARRLTNNDEEALDATQEIFIRIWRGLAGFRGEAKLSTWVFQIAWNYLRWKRRQRGRQAALFAVPDPDAGDVMDRAADAAPDPERRASSAELLSRVDDALQRLPEHYRVVIWLRDGEDLSYEEIAATLDVPIGTVRSRLARGREALRREVEGR
jgi:RNA polymerase sigma-70 factor (ECF subfamily)